MDGWHFGYKKKIIKEKKTQLYMNGCNFSCKKNS